MARQRARPARPRPTRARAERDGHAGHAERHTSALAALAEALRGAFGASRVVTPDTDRHAGWEEMSPDCRPDLGLPVITSVLTLCYLRMCMYSSAQKYV